jgi:thiol-disulfide isomerase/thioredoxin/Tfp pilus assembly protein PilF
MSVVVWGQTDNVFKISTDKPKLGDDITISYNSEAKGAVLKNAGEILLCVLGLQSNGMPAIEEIKMTKSGSLWQASYALKDSLLKVLFFRFDTETATDDNGGNTWRTLVYNNNGQAVEKAHATMAMVLQRGSVQGFKVTLDKEKAKQETVLEKQLYPNPAPPSKINQFYSTYQSNKDKKEVVEQVVKDIEAFIAENKDKEDQVASAISLLNYMKQTEKAKQLTEEQLKINPNGKVAVMNRQNKVYNEKDKTKQIEYAEIYLKEIPNLPQDEKDLYNSLIFNDLIDLKKFDEAYNAAVKMPKQNGTIYNSLAWPLIEKGEQLEKAVTWAKKGVELARTNDIADKSKYQTTKDWKKSSRVSLGYVLDTYGFGLYQLGKFEEAEKSYEECMECAKAELSEDAHARYIECLNKNSKFEKAATFGEECINIGKASEKLLAEYKIAFLKANKGNENDIEKKLAEIKAEGDKKAKDKIAKELVNKPAPLFSLKSLEGKTVNLADLKGKVVVVDFWATWCGPCKASFPTLQKVYDKYKDNPNVVILAVNTWENESGAEREKTVKDFIKENKYTFPVLFDIDERAKAFVTQFGVEGIPTKFILDKEGNIQFKTVGFGGEKEMLDDLEAQFDLLLKDGHKALLKK